MDVVVSSEADADLARGGPIELQAERAVIKRPPLAHSGPIAAGVGGESRNLRPVSRDAGLDIDVITRRLSGDDDEILGAVGIVAGGAGGERASDGSGSGGGL